MWWGGYGWWWPGLVAMGVFMVSCVVLMAWMMRGRMGRMGSMGGMCGFGRRRSGRHGRHAPEQLLDERLARGEIDITEYRRVQKALAGTSSSANSEQADDQQ